jgi:hypothetical protein
MSTETSPTRREAILAAEQIATDWESLYRSLSEAVDLLATEERWEEQQRADNPGGGDFHNALLRERVLSLLSQTPCED